MPRTPKSKSSSSLSGAPGPITMQGLAKLAGTSTNTVSLALRDSPRLSLKTRKKIHDLAALHKYRPNPLISALVKSRNLQAPEQTLAVLTKFSAPLFPHPERQMIFCRELLLGMQAKASELGFRLEEFPTNLPDSPDGVRLTQILQTRAIRGVILFPSGDLAVEHPELDWSQFAVVAGNFHTKRMWVHRTAADYSRGMEICLAELQARGYRRIGLAFSKCLDPRLRYGCSGRFLAWREQQPEDRRVPLMDSEEEYPTNDVLHEWIAQYRPDAVISHVHYFPEGVIAYNAAHGTEIGIAHLDLPSRVPCAGVDLRIPDVGRATVAVLARELFFNRYGVPEVPEVCLVGGVWREGPGIRPRAKGAVRDEPEGVSKLT